MLRTHLQGRSKTLYLMSPFSREDLGILPFTTDSGILKTIKVCVLLSYAGGVSLPTASRRRPEKADSPSLLHGDIYESESF